jgi:pimeloyl-ACP methyl ester carboxylesterase
LVVSLVTALSFAALAGGAVVDRKARARETGANAAYPPLGQFVMVGDRRVHLHLQGAGPDLVMIHGASGNLRDFTFRFAGQMARDYRVIAVDRPGLGYTSRAHDALDGAFAAGAESTADQAGLLIAALRQLGVTRPLVLGHSYGTAVAMEFAVAGFAAGIIAVGGASMPWPDGELDLYYRVNGSRLGGAMLPPLITAFAPQSRVDEAIAAIFAPDPVPDGYAAYVGADLTIRRTSLRANARQVGVLYRDVTRLSALYPGLRLPVEFIHGQADQVVPAEVHSVRAAALIPDAGLALLAGVGHMPHHTAPLAVEAAIHRAAARAGLR